MLKFPDFDDKDLVIFCVTIIGIVSIFFVENPTEVLNPIITGLFGVAVGKKLKGNDV